MNLNIPPISHQCAICPDKRSEITYNPQEHLKDCEECKQKVEQLSKDSAFRTVFKAHAMWALYYAHTHAVINESFEYTAASYEVSAHRKPLEQLEARRNAVTTSMNANNQRLLVDIVLHMFPLAGK